MMLVYLAKYLKQTLWIYIEACKEAAMQAFPVASLDETFS